MATNLGHAVVDSLHAVQLQVQHGPVRKVFICSFGDGCANAVLFSSGFLDPTISAKWGVVDFDWSNAKGAWTRQRPMDCEERLVAQADLVRSANPHARVWVYRNLVKALPW